MQTSRIVFWLLAASAVSACSGGGGAIPTQPPNGEGALSRQNAATNATTMEAVPDADTLFRGSGIAREYRLTDLGSGIPGSPGLAVSGLNISGDVTLNASTGQLTSLPSCGLPTQLPCGPVVGVVYRNGSLRVLPPLAKGQTTFTNTINDEGVIGGYSASSVTSYAVLWKPDLSTVNLGTGITPPGSGAEVDALDNHGRIYGDSFNATVDIPIIFDSDNDSKPIAPCGSAIRGYFRSANDVGLGIGDQLLIAGGTAAMVCPPFRRIADPANPQWLNFGFAINNQGEAAGRNSPGPNITIFHPFLYRDGRVTDLGTPLFPGNRFAVGAAFGINNEGTIVGWTGAGGGVIGPPRVLPIDPKAFIYCGGKTVDLNKLLPPSVAKEWTLIIADQINDRGQIAAIAYKGGYPNGVEHAVLLTPQYW